MPGEMQKRLKLPEAQQPFKSALLLQSYPVSSGCFFHAVCLTCGYSTPGGVSITDIPDLGNLSLLSLPSCMFTVDIF